MFYHERCTSSLKRSGATAPPSIVAQTLSVFLALPNFTLRIGEEIFFPLFFPSPRFYCPFSNGLFSFYQKKK
uniref:Uncharacterized protein n=1 Tax=Nelumbo nucifera TaxID=4432 RepID=A0A822YS05_NELNU|nr:TPA_asm: hypothetical protein HUJ06_005543 [Nelumbo nucifera]